MKGPNCHLLPLATSELVHVDGGRSVCCHTRLNRASLEHDVAFIVASDDTETKQRVTSYVEVRVETPYRQQFPEITTKWETRQYPPSLEPYCFS